MPCQAGANHGAAPLSAEAALPDSDGLPMAENDEHFRAILPVRPPLEVRFRNSANTYASGDLLLFCNHEDVLVAERLAKRFRRSYLL